MFSWCFLGGGVLDEQPLAPTTLEWCSSSHAPAQLAAEYPFACGLLRLLRYWLSGGPCLWGWLEPDSELGVGSWDGDELEDYSSRLRYSR